MPKKRPVDRGKPSPKAGDDAAALLGASLSLEDWLVAVQDPKRHRNAATFYFPTEQHRDEYLRGIAKRSDPDVRLLLRRFLIQSGTLKADLDMYGYLARQEKAGAMISKTEFARRLSDSVKTNGRIAAWEGITWVLDLLPDSPRKALNILDAYLDVHAQFMPDGCLAGMADARAVMRTKYITGDVDASEKSLRKLKPRELEVLIAALYRAKAYETKLTRPTKDGGRDVIATRTEAGRRERVLIECKHQRRPIGDKDTCAFGYVVYCERATKGVLVSSSHFTRGAKKRAAEDQRLDLVDRQSLVPLLNEHLGPSWPLKVDQWVVEDARERLKARALRARGPENDRGQ